MNAYTGLKKKINNKQAIVTIVGLGYVGLPLAVAFGNRRRTIGFDLNEEKLNCYRRCMDPSGEVGADALAQASQLEYTSDPVRLGRP